MIFSLKTTCILGLRGFGKSTFAEAVVNGFGSRALVYDTVKEYPINKNYDIYRPHDPYSLNELIAVINNRIKTAPAGSKPRKKYALLAIDEFNRFAPPHKDLHPALVELNDQLRHEPFTIGVIYIARRPVQIHPDIINLADQVICFNLSGVRDISYLNDLKAGFGDRVSMLPKHHAMIYSEGQFKWIEPLKIDAMGVLLK